MSTWERYDLDRLLVAPQRELAQISMFQAITHALRSLHRRHVGLLALASLSFAASTTQAFAAAPNTVAVFEFRNTSSYRESGDRVGLTLMDLFSTALFKTGKFQLVERQRLDQIARETTDIPEAYFMDDELVQRIGRLVGATHYLIGNVTQFSYTGCAPDYDPMFQVTKYRTRARLTVDLRLIETETGRIVHADAVSDEVDRSFERSGKPAGGGCGKGSEFRTFEDLGRSVAERSAQALAAVAYPVRVVKVDGTRVYLNRGSGQDVKVGWTCELVREGELLVDPDTGLELGAATESIGRARVIEVHEKYSIAEVGDASVRDRDICR